MNKNTSSVLWLSAVCGLSAGKIVKLCTIKEPAELVANLEGFRDRIVKVTDDKTYGNMLKLRDREALKERLEALSREHVTIISQYDTEYPPLLAQIPNAPVLLYCKGDVSLLRAESVAIVGTRQPSTYGKDVASRFAESLASAGLCIVSGLAKGIDSIAHESAMKVGKTVAVLGCGIDVIYPQENKNLYATIEEEGLLVSEYGLGEKAVMYHFPERNRIISGLSKAVMVAEAGEDSGSLITATIAIEQGRGVYCAPSSVFSKKGAGGNSFLKTLQGTMVLEPDDILSDLGYGKAKRKKASALQLDVNEQLIMDALEVEELHFDTLLELTKLSVPELSALLGRMELYGIVRREDNNNYSVVPE